MNCPHCSKQLTEVDKFVYKCSVCNKTYLEELIWDVEYDGVLMSPDIFPEKVEGHELACTSRLLEL
jgi:hypothetical protein